MKPESRADRIGNSRRIRPYYLRAGIILIVALCVAGLTFALSTQQTKMYRATVVLMYGPQVDPANPYAQSITDAQTLLNQLTSVGRLVKEPAVVHDATTTILDNTPLRVPYYVSTSVATTPTYSAAVIAAASASPRMAQVAASAYAERFIAWRKSAEIRQWTISLDSVYRRMKLEKNPASPTYLALQQQLQTDLQAKDAAFGSFRVIQPATIPSQPYTPKPVRNAIVAFVVVILAGSGVALLLDETNGRLRDARDARRVLRVPVLGELQRSRSAAGNGSIASAESLSPGEKTALNVVRANVEFLLTDLGARSVAFVSLEDGQIASSVACDLAVSLARAGRRVAVVDGDARHAYVAGHFGLDGGSGVTSVVAGDLALEDAAHLLDVGSSLEQLEGLAQARIRILCAEPTAADPAVINRSHGFATLVERLAEDDEIVVVVAPAFEGADDAAVVCSRADGVICVVDLATARRRSLEAAQDRLQGLPCGLLGAVLVTKAAQAKSPSSPAMSAVTIDTGTVPEVDGGADADAVQA